MKEYIERAAVEAMLENAQIITDGENCGYCTDDVDLNSIPTIDAVPVVRCEECKHLNVINDPKLYAHCPKTNTAFLPFDLDTREHFCSLGQQKIETILPKSDAKDESLEGEHGIM